MAAAAIGALLGGAGSLFGAMMQARAQEAANQINWKNYYLQRDIAKDQTDLAKASRTDAYGNKVEYIPGVGWQTVTTPLTKALLNANQVENLNRSTKDAKLRRKALQRNEGLREDAGRDAKNAAREARYYVGPGDDEIALLKADETISGQRETNRQMRDVLAKQALRLGNSSALDDIVRETRKGAVDVLGDALTKGKLAALTMGPQLRDQGRANLDRRAAGLTSVASGMDATPMGTSSANEEMTGLTDAMINAMMQAYGSSATNQGNALSGLSAGIRDSYVNPGDALRSIGAGISGMMAPGGEVAGATNASGVGSRQIGGRGLTPEYWNDDYLEGGSSPSSAWWTM